MVAHTRSRRREKTVQVEVHVLDGFAVLAHGQPVVDASWSRKKPQALVTVLALHGRPVHRDAVLTALWRDLDPAAAATNLRKCRYHLRAKLAEADVDDIIEMDGDTYRLRDGVETDIATFRRRANEALASRDPAGLAAATFAYEAEPDSLGAWARPLLEELRVLNSDLLMQLAALHEDGGDPDAAIETLEQLLSDEPAHEAAHRALMRLYASSERPATALRQFERCKEALRTDLGVAPAVETVELRELVLRSIYRSANPSPTATAGPLVGRGEEMRLLNRTLTAALEGQGQAMFISGDPGMGKSRLLEEFATLATLLDVRVVRGQSFADSRPFEPWIQILRQVAGRPRKGSAGQKTLRNYVSEVPEQTPAASDESQRHARSSLLDIVRDFIERTALQQPMAILLEDIHAADPDSLALLRHIVLQIGGTPLILLCTHRSTGTGTDLNELTSLAAESHVSLLDLEPIDDVAARALLAAAGKRVSSTSTAAFLARARGNPLFLTEFARRSRRDERSDRGVSRGEGRLPTRVHDAIKEHVRELPEGCRGLLRLASALGIRLPLPVLEEIFQVNAEQFVEQIRPAIEADVLREVGAGAPVFEFAHPLFGETLYDELSPEDQVDIHQRIAETLERRYEQGLDTSPADLAHHFLRALPRVDLAQALDWARRAGDEATEALAFEEAARWYGRVLRAIEDWGGASEADRYDHLMRFALAARRIGDTAVARERLREAAEVALEVGSAEQVGSALREYLGTHLPAFRVDERLVDLAERGLDLVEENDTPARAVLLAVLGRALIWSRNVGRRAAVSAEAISLARRLGDTEVLGYALFSWHYTELRPGNVEERLRVSSEYLEITEALGDAERLSHAHRHHLVDLLQLGDMDGVDQDLAAIEELTDESTHPGLRRQLLGIKSMRATVEGDFARAEQLALDAHRELRKAQVPDANALLGYQILAVRGEQGRLAEMESAVKASVEQYTGFAGARVLLAMVYAETGKHIEARDQFELLAQRDFTDIADDQTRLPILAGLAQVCATLGDESRAGTLYELLLPHALHAAVTSEALVCSGSLSRHLGLLAITLQRWNEAERHFEDALTMNECMRSPPLVARTQVDYATMLIARARDGDRERAGELLSGAREVARELGMNGLLRRIERLA